MLFYVSKLMMNDAEAVKSAINGREEGYRAIFANHSAFLFTHALRILRNRQGAEDAVQETFSAAFRSIAAFRGEARLRTWLYQILYRSSLRIASRETASPSTETAAAGKSHADRVDLKLDVDSVLAQLNERDRAVLIMTYWDEMPLKEAAEILEVSENNAKIILFRARRKFARLWGQNGGKEQENNEV